LYRKRGKGFGRVAPGTRRSQGNGNGNGNGNSNSNGQGNSRHSVGWRDGGGQQDTP